MATGLIALLDDVAGLAKLAAASIDDATGQAARASAKAAGVVIDDAAVTPRYVVGFAAERELPIIWRIAVGSFKNKLLYLLPAAILLSLLAPWAITPLLMLGGAYLCFEGAEKAYEALWPHAHEAHGPGASTAPQTAEQLEQEKIRGAIQTDLILSAEIMAITLASVATSSYAQQIFVLAIVGIGITVAVYGVVALIVKADDVGAALAAGERPASALWGWVSRGPAAGAPSAGDRALRPVTTTIGRGLVLGMPVLLKMLSIIGTAAMLWVGGGIIVHGLEEFGVAGPAHVIHDAAAAVGHALPALGATLEWLVSAAASGVIGLAIGAALIPFANRVVTPALSRLKRSNGRAQVGTSPGADGH